MKKQKWHWILLFALATLTACPNATPIALEPKIVEVTFNNIQNSSMTASAKVISSGLNTRTLNPNTFSLPDYSLVSQSQSTFTYNGNRYLAATFQVVLGDNAYIASNFSFVALANTSLVNPTLLGTAVSSLKKYDGTDADPAIARQVVPLHAMEFDGLGISVKQDAANLQVWSHNSEIATLTPPANSTLLDYGFVARNNIYGVTFAFKLPLQASRKDDPYSLSFRFAVYNDDTTQVTESFEELGTNNVESRAIGAGATQINIFNGSSFTSPTRNVRKLCGVRIAVPASASGPYSRDVYLYPTISTGCVR